MFRKLYKQLHNRIRLLHNKGREPYLSLSKILGFYPDNLQIYEQALLHKSSSVETGDGKWLNNERLEFLGDAVLELVSSEQRETMNKVAVQLGLDQMVVYSTKINSHNNHMYGNALEALIGAIYLDQGYDVCYKFIRDVMIEKYIDVDMLVRKEINFKSNLIEWSQKNKISISFDLIESFTDHDGNPVFQSAIKLLGEQIGIGIGYSKKESQQAASKMAVKRLRTDKELQQRISATKKKKAGELTDEKEFSDLPEEETV